jgi:hypothetical protein
VIHLGNLAYWNHKSLRWNPAEWRFNDPADDALLDYKRREPWQLPEV